MVGDVEIHHVDSAHRTIVLLTFMLACDVVVLKTHKVTGFVDICVSVHRLKSAFRLIFTIIHEVI